MGAYRFDLGSDFYEAEWPSKGYYPSAKIIVDGRVYPISFYDPVRLRQDVDCNIEGGDFFFESNLVVVPSIEEGHMEKAAEWLVSSGHIAFMVAE